MRTTTSPARRRAGPRSCVANRILKPERAITAIRSSMILVCAGSRRSLHRATAVLAGGQVPGQWQGVAVLRPTAAGLDVRPLVTERFDMLMRQRESYLRPLQTLLGIIASPAFAARAAELGGLDASTVGTVRWTPKLIANSCLFCGVICGLFCAVLWHFCICLILRRVLNLPPRAIRDLIRPAHQGAERAAGRAYDNIGRTAAGEQSERGLRW
jgi:hypothetical protein